MKQWNLKDVRKVLLKIHRILSWLLVLASILTIGSGYTDSRKLTTHLAVVAKFHRVAEWSFIIMLGLHLLLSMKFGRIKWKSTLNVIRKRKGLDFHLVRVLQRVSSWFIVLFSAIVIFSGFAENEQFSSNHGRHSVYAHLIFDLALTLFIIFHIGTGVRFFLLRKKVPKKKALLLAAGVMIVLLIPVLVIELLYPRG